MELGQTLALAGSTMQLTSKLAQGREAEQEGRTARAVAEYEAGGLQRQAKEEVAAAQRDAIEQRQATARLTSKQRALGAASGSAMTSPGLLDIFSDTEGEGEYRAQAAQYVGDQRAAGLRDKANVRVAEGYAAEKRGKAAKRGSILEGFAGHFGNMSKIYEKKKFG